MPYHTGSSKQEIRPKKMNSTKPKKELKEFKKQPANSHLMPDGTIMSGKTHSKKSKILGKLKK